jgi:hypothetical protein
VAGEVVRGVVGHAAARAFDDDLTLLVVRRLLDGGRGSPDLGAIVREPPIGYSASARSRWPTKLWRRAGSLSSEATTSWIVIAPSSSAHAETSSALGLR